MRRSGYYLAVGLFNVVAVVVLIEAVLRLFPRLIPIPDLLTFSPSLRGDIAERRQLPRLSVTRVLARDDGGPPLRLFVPFATVRVKQRDRDAVASVTMDERGFCNPAGAAPGGRSDIVTVGDSFTFCTSVEAEQTWTVQLGRLEGRSAYNLGLGGVGVHEYLQILKAHGTGLSPRTVVMNVYEGNDMRDALALIESRRGGPASPEAARDPAHAPWLLEHSYAAALAASRLGYRADPPPRSGLRDLIDALRRRYGEPDFRYTLRFAGGDVPFNGENTDVDEPLFARALADGGIAPQVWHVWREALGELSALARRHGFVPVVSYTPSAHTAYAAVVVFDDPTLAPVLRAFSDAQRAFFRAETARLGMLHVDLTPALQAAGADGAAPLLYRPNNLHLTPEGHTVIAGALHAALPR